ncbi:hypothetical protein GW835_03830 [archaeon]|nr:hypothetical protein [archaeon]NCP79667.1 hypothetical protein [archaeon]NCP97957.1 hypothetical protein [archaeon]NCQ07433.1 hypothetical protein [archaeon]NCT58640.1 hypothetical protein [archaeon]
MLFFLFITLENNLNETTDLIIIKQIETRKENIYYNFEKTIKNTLNDCESNPLVVKEKISSNIFEYGNKNNFYIQNTISKEKNKITLLDTTEIIRVIIYRPSERILIKEAYITRGIFYNKQLLFIVKNRNYQETFNFPKNYFIREVVFC